MSELNEKTRVPLGAVLLSLPVLVGGILWLASVDSKATAASADAKNLLGLVLDIRDRLSTIEGLLKQRK